MAMNGKYLDIRRLIRSFGFAWQGISYTFATQQNMRVHLCAALLTIGLGVWLKVTREEWLLLLLAISSVIVAEMMNTAVEAAVDLFVDHHHPLAKIAKDVAAGAVLLAAVVALVIGVVIFGPRL